MLEFSSNVLLMDIDGTLTPPRQPIEKKMSDYLERLSIPFFVAAGSDFTLLDKQFFSPLKEFGFKKDLEAFINNGSIHYQFTYSEDYRYSIKEEFNIREHLGEDDYKYLIGVLKEALANSRFKLEEPLKVIGETIVDRGGMINFSTIGRPVKKENLNESEIENREWFVEFDRKNEYRQKMKTHIETCCEKLILEKNLLVMLGGETSFDIVIKGKDKTNAVRILLEREGIESVTFIGDALFNGGNDSVIMEYIETWNNKMECPLKAVPVKSWEDTIRVFEDNNWLR